MMTLLIIAIIKQAVADALAGNAEAIAFLMGDGADLAAAVLHIRPERVRAWAAQPRPPVDPWLTVDEAAAAAGLRKHQIGCACTRGHIESALVPVGSNNPRRYIHRDALALFLDTRNSR